VKTAALTLWFTLATLLGPLVCCCSVAKASHARLAENQPENRPAAPPRAKSCCAKHTAAEPAAVAPSVLRHDPQPAKPAKCPCEPTKRAVTSLPPKTAEPPAKPAALDTEPPADLFADSRAAGSLRIKPVGSVYHLAGRDLLAVYSVLTC
jgi:hypothetical protein